MSECFQAALDNDTLVPGMITGIHTSGNFINQHQHLHALISPGCFDKELYHIPFMPDKEKLEKLLMHKVLKMMMDRGKINDDVVERSMRWTHSGFKCLCNRDR